MGSSSTTTTLGCFNVSDSLFMFISIFVLNSDAAAALPFSRCRPVQGMPRTGCTALL